MSGGGLWVVGSHVTVFTAGSPLSLVFCFCYYHVQRDVHVMTQTIWGIGFLLSS